MIASKDNYSLE